MSPVGQLLFLLIISLFLPLHHAQAVQGIQYLNVGGSGSYNQVTNMVANNGQWNVCPTDIPTCDTTPVSVSSSLAPFDEDLTIALRGPMVVGNVAVYVPNGDDWVLQSYWDQTNANTTNLVWMNNAGDWSICQGNGQSYMASDGSSAATSPQPFNGVLSNDMNVNLMSAVECNSTICPGYNRGVAMVGWAGNNCGDKMFAINVTMPYDTSGSSNNNNAPAIWFLNGQVVRTNQWGCNCRGMGGDGGCGELDIAEVIPGNADDQCTSTLYSFKQSLGSANYFSRPFTTAATYVTIFDSYGTGSISILEQSSFPFSSTIIPQSTVNQWVSDASPATVTLEDPYTGPACEGGLSAITQGDVAVNGASGLGEEATIGVAVGVVVVVLAAVGIVVLVRGRRRNIMEIV